MDKIDLICIFIIVFLFIINIIYAIYIFPDMVHALPLYYCSGLISGALLIEVLEDIKK